MKLSLLTALVLVSVILCHAKDAHIGTGIIYENCGPPFKLLIEPNPPKILQNLNITIEFVAAHDLIAGVVEAYVNTWPYHYKDVYCANGKTFDPKGCYFSKGEKRVISHQGRISESFKEMDYAGNATLRNEDGELLLCVRFRMNL